MRCKVCNKKLKLTKDRRYEVIIGLIIMETHEAFDCTHCGCQNVLNKKEKRANDDTIGE